MASAPRLLGGSQTSIQKRGTSGLISPIHGGDIETVGEEEIQQETPKGRPTLCGWGAQRGEHKGGTGRQQGPGIGFHIRGSHGDGVQKAPWKAAPQPPSKPNTTGLQPLLTPPSAPHILGLPMEAQMLSQPSVPAPTTTSAGSSSTPHRAQRLKVKEKCNNNLRH